VTALHTRPRLLKANDAAAVGELVGRDPLVNCVFDARFEHAPDLDVRRLGGHIWGITDDSSGALRAALFHGGNLIPLGEDFPALEIIATHLARLPRGCSSIVGPAAAVHTIWPMLMRSWGPARAIRPNQPFLVAVRVPDYPFDPTVRVVRPAELGRFLPAAAAMFTEELGVSPIGADGGTTYRGRLAELIGAGRAFARFDDSGDVEFKAEIGAVGADSAQIQGVWVRPELRGRGIGTAGMAAVLRHAMRLAPSASLYVNDFNGSARRMYARLGMRQTHTFSTVLF
jgi:predicted GNAT family acetyltransferase